MHIRDGILSPEICLATAVLSAGAVGFSLRQMRLQLADRTVPYTGMTAALIFAAQMVNFPLFIAPVSGHLIGGVLAGALLGPWAGCVALTLVLMVQALLFADGGLLSLGANVLNMAVLGTWAGGALFAGLRKLLGSSSSATVASSVCAAYVSVLAAAFGFCLEFGLSHRSGNFDMGRVAMLMLLFHAVIGLGEGIITGLVVHWVLLRRPDMLAVQTPVPAAAWPTRRYFAAGLACALVIAVVLAPFKSEFDDGLDAVSQRTGFDVLATERALLLDDYLIPLPAGLSPVLSVSLAGFCGTLFVFAVGWLLARVVAVKRITGNES